LRESAAMSEPRTREVNCKICFRPTRMPIGNPPFGTALICSHCHSPLVGATTKAGAPLSAPPGLLRRLSGYSGRCLIHPRCPWCSQINYAIVAPAAGRSTPWHEQKEPGEAEAFCLTIPCAECGKEFYVQWDEPPLPPECSLCRRRIGRGERSTSDARFCKECGRRLSQVRPRRKGEPPLGAGVECVLLVGFSRTARDGQVKALLRSDRETQGVPLARLMLSGGVPKSPVESAVIAVQVAASAGRKTAGHDIDLAKVTYQPFQDLLLVKIWK